MRVLTRLSKTPQERRILSPHQLRFLACQAKLRTNCSGRRSGKTYAVVLWLVEEWRGRANQSSVFIALTVEHAIRIAWATFEELNARFGWGAVPNSAMATWTFPNGFVLWFGGCKDRSHCNRYRGVPRLHRVAVDECGQVPDPLLAYLVVDVLEPAMADTDGSICLTGTPSDLREGFYEDTMAACEEEGAHFVATAADNPHLAVDGAQFLADVLAKRFGGNVEDARYRREYLGQRVKDASVLIYTPGLVHEAPPAHGYTSMGIDIGWNDGWGFTVVRARPQGGAHVLHAYREEKLLFGRAAAIAEGLVRKYRVAEVFVDSAGGGGRTIAETLDKEYGLNAHPATKSGGRFARRPRIEMVRTMLASGSLTGTKGECDQLENEWRLLPWDTEHADHREGYIDECTDALQYALQGVGFTSLTSWEVEPTPEEVQARRVAEIRRGRLAAGRRR